MEKRFQYRDADGNIKWSRWFQFMGKRKPRWQLRHELKNEYRQ